MSELFSKGYPWNWEVSCVINLDSFKYPCLIQDSLFEWEMPHLVVELVPAKGYCVDWNGIQLKTNAFCIFYIKVASSTFNIVSFTSSHGKQIESLHYRKIRHSQDTIRTVLLLLTVLVSVILNSSNWIALRGDLQSEDYIHLSSTSLNKRRWGRQTGRPWNLVLSRYEGFHPAGYFLELLCFRESLCSFSKIIFNFHSHAETWENLEFSWRRIDYLFKN